MGLIVQRPVHPIGSLSAASRVLNDGYDVSIGGVPFLTAITPDTPYDRETTKIQKDQLDTTAEPGEQSLAAWWLRSQSSFHGGMGLVYQEAQDREDTDVPIRYAVSAGVDVFSKPGQVTLLPTTTALTATPSASSVTHGTYDGNTPVVFYSEGSALYRTTGSTLTAVNWGGTGTITSITSDGTSYLVADSAGIWKGTLAGGNGTKIYSTSGKVTLGWVKQRLMAGVANKIYELDSTVSVLTALPGTPNYTHPSANWTWSCFTASPGAILAAGYAHTSAIYKFVLDTQGAVPTLTGAIVAAELPTDEFVYSMAAYVGSFLGIGTTKGVRVAIIDDDKIRYGPLTCSTPSPVRCMTGRGRLLYAGYTNGIDGLSGLMAIDLGRAVDGTNGTSSFTVMPGKYAYASHLQAHVSGTVTGVALLGSRLSFSVASSGLYLEHATDLETSGYVKTGRIRFHTLEPKVFVGLRIRSAPLVGSIQVDVTDPADREIYTGVFNGQGSVPPEVTLLAPPSEYATVKMTLTRQTATTGPTLYSYQLKALPAQKRQRTITVPLSCFDSERDRFGQDKGFKGWAAARIRALENLEDAGVPVLAQFFSPYPEDIETRLVSIDAVKFTQTTSPQEDSTVGGLLTVTLRTLS